MQVNWLSQDNANYKQSFNDGKRAGAEGFIEKYGAILDLLQSGDEITEAAGVLKHARLLEGKSKGRFVTDHKMSLLQQ